MSASWPRRAFVDRFEMLGQLKTQFGVVIPGYGVADGEWYRLITAAFLHVPLSQGTFGITHILFNMWALWVLGPQLEQVLGRVRFTALYLLSALGGNVLLFLVDPTQPARRRLGRDLRPVRGVLRGRTPPGDGHQGDRVPDPDQPDVHVHLPRNLAGKATWAG